MSSAPKSAGEQFEVAIVGAGIFGAAAAGDAGFAAGPA